MADPRESRTIETLLGVLGLIYAVDQFTRLFPPSYGPRLRPGELTAEGYSSRAVTAYWKAENASARGECDAASHLFETGEYYRRKAEARAARGDHTAKDIRGSQRVARDELRTCETGKGLGVASRRKRR